MRRITGVGTGAASRAVCGVVLAATIALMLLGFLRYGSVEGMYRRVHAEIAARRPHPQYVPTALPIPSPQLPPRPGSPVLSGPLASSGQDKAGMAPARSDAMPHGPGDGTGHPATPSPSRAPHTTLVLVQPGPTGSPQVSELTPSGKLTLTPTPTDRPEPTVPGATPPATSTPMPSSIQLTGVTHMWQTWNNCGPATLAMNLSYYGYKMGQGAVAAAIRPNKEDKNVSPEELAAFARTLGLHALARVNGDPDRLRRLLASGIPVLVETWHEPKPNDGMGHYRLLTGYDHGAGVWTAYDSYDAKGVDPKKPYSGVRISYDELNRLWDVFNRQYIVIYTDTLAPQAERILGDNVDDAAMWQRALEDAQATVAAKPGDAFAWFNLGSDLTALGRYTEAVNAYDRARKIGLPWRMLWYQFGPFQAYYAVGRYDEVIALANATLRMATYVEELYYWRGLAQQAQGQISQARASYQRALEMNEFFQPASDALLTLPTAEP